ncbi:MAG: V4R domain-containing protein [Candidatus Helarchaeota archaeon]
MTTELKEKKEIAANVFYALLTALNDIMGQDGKNSVLKYARLDQYINQCIPQNLTPQSTIDYNTFHALLESMFTLLGFGTSAILFEAGRKWLIYLMPFGLSLKEMIIKLENWIGGKWSYTKEGDTEIVTVHECPICFNFKSTTGKPLCHIISGALSKIKESETGDRYEVIEDKCMALGHDCCEFKIIKKLKFNVNEFLKE